MDPERSGRREARPGASASGPHSSSRLRLVGRRLSLPPRVVMLVRRMTACVWILAGAAKLVMPEIEMYRSLAHTLQIPAASIRSLYFAIALVEIGVGVFMLPRRGIALVDRASLLLSGGFGVAWLMFDRYRSHCGCFGTLLQMSATTHGVFLAFLFASSYLICIDHYRTKDD